MCLLYNQLPIILRIVPVVAVRQYLNFRSIVDPHYLSRRKFSVSQSLLQIFCKEAQQLIVLRRFEELNSCSDKILLSRYRALLDLGITAEIILRHPRLLLKTSESYLNFYHSLRDIGIPENSILNLIEWKDSLLSKIITTCKRDMTKYSENRIQFMASKLKISQDIIISHIIKYPFLLTLSFEHLRNSIDVLLKSGIKTDDILRDPWVLRCKTDHIINRVRKLDEAEVDIKKTWMTRCTNDIFQSFLSRVSKKQKLLGEHSLEEYLSERLGCSTHEIKEIIDREPQLQKTGVLKMKRILDFLFGSGFNSSQIVAGLPRVANRRIETIHSRLVELNQLRISPSLYILCKSKREYLYYINKIKTSSGKQR